MRYSALVVCFAILSPLTILGCKSSKPASLVARGDTFAEMRGVKGEITVASGGEAKRAPYPRERLSDGSELTLAPGALAWIRRDGGAVWLVAAVWEACYLPLPHVPPGGARTLTVIGDSVTAGMGETDVSTWPKLLARKHNIKVQDLSVMGFKTDDALEKLTTDPVHGRVVFVEIGGNDLLGGETAAKFRRRCPPCTCSWPKARSCR